MDNMLHHGHRRQRVSYIRNRGGLDLSYDVETSCSRRVAGRYVCCWCGVQWDVEGGWVSPYVGIHVGGIGWKYGGPLVAKIKQILLKVKQRRQLADAPGLIPLQQAQCVLDQWQGSWGVLFA